MCGRRIVGLLRLLVRSVLRFRSMMALIVAVSARGLAFIGFCHSLTHPVSRGEFGGAKLSRDLIAL